MPQKKKYSCAIEKTCGTEVPQVWRLSKNYVKRHVIEQQGEE